MTRKTVSGRKAVLLLVALFSSPAFAHAKTLERDEKAVNRTTERVVHAVKKGLKKAGKAVDHVLTRADHAVRRTLKHKQ